VVFKARMLFSYKYEQHSDFEILVYAIINSVFPHNPGKRGMITEIYGGLILWD
jgi:hypothetical protein